MGKGDKKSKRGKIVIGSYGVRRRRKADKAAIPAKVVNIVEVIEKVEPAEETKTKAPKKISAPKKKKETEEPAP